MPEPSNRVFIPVDGSRPCPACADADWREHAWAGQSMGTTWSVRAWAPAGVAPQRLARAIDEELQHTIDLFSHWHTHSEVAGFNAAPAGDWRFSEKAWALIDRSLDLARATGGTVDPTLGALVDLWGFGPPGPRRPPALPWPDAAQIQAARQASGWQRVRVGPLTRTLRKPDGLRLDLGGIAKGWAVDQVSARLLHEGASVHLVEIGGELKARGLKPARQPWWVELEAPGPLPGQPPATAPTRRDLLALVDGAVATSGDWQRHIAHAGRVLAHTLDGRTGWPALHGIAAVTVLHEEAMQADALASALTVMGPGAAMDWAARHALATRITVRTPQGLAEHLSPAFAALLAP